MLVTVALALFAAFLFAVASVLQQRAAATVPDEDALNAGLITRLVKQPMWLAGLGADAVGYLTQAAALAIGSLIIVQPLLVTMLLFALPLSARYTGRKLAPADFAWAVVLTAGLAVFLIVGDPTDGNDEGDGRAWLAALVVIYPLVIVLVSSAARRRGAHRALLLGSAAGVLYGTTDALTKTVVRGLDDGLVSVVANWETWALIISICAGAFLQQSAYQAGGLRASLPSITGLEPLTGTLLGVLIYHERFRVDTAASRLLLVASAGAAIVAALALARSAGRAEAASAGTGGAPVTPG